jgi:putative salt-induced outer membrane protein YdiY
MQPVDSNVSVFRSTCAALIALSVGFSVSAADASEGEGGWTPPSPVDLPTKLDWVQLPSGEWLGGEVIALYEGTLEFDSKEMGLTQIDWDDVVELRTVQVLRVRPITGVPASGQLLLKERLLSVMADRPVFIAQNEVLTVTAGVAIERYYWSGEVSGNLNTQSGNSDSRTFNLRAFAQRRSAGQRITGEYIVDFDETDGDETKNNHRITVDWDRFVTDRLFWSPVSGEYYKDKFKNIKHRISLGPAIGYHLVDTSRTSWRASGGPAYTQTWFDQVEPGEDDRNSSPAIFGSTRIDHELTGDLDLWYDYRLLLAKKNTGGYSHRMELGSSLDVFGDLDLRVSYVWDFISDPVEGQEGDRPKSSDTQLRLGVGYSF